jgi:hypothetical protein
LSLNLTQRLGHESTSQEKENAMIYNPWIISTKLSTTNQVFLIVPVFTGIWEIGSGAIWKKQATRPPFAKASGP